MFGKGTPLSSIDTAELLSSEAAGRETGRRGEFTRPRLVPTSSSEAARVAREVRELASELGYEANTTLGGRA